jgi:hypothetical protein
MSQTLSGIGSCAEKAEELSTALACVERVIAYRESYLKAFERLLVSKLMSQQVTLLNLGSQRKISLRSAREGSMLSLELKLLRRNLFLLRVQRASLQKRLQDLTPAQEHGEPKPEDVQPGVTEGVTTDVAVAS